MCVLCEHSVIIENIKYIKRELVCPSTQMKRMQLKRQSSLQHNVILFHAVHPCEKKSKGGCSDICIVNGKEALCACPEGWKLVDAKICIKSKFLFPF